MKKYGFSASKRYYLHIGQDQGRLFTDRRRGRLTLLHAEASNDERTENLPYFEDLEIGAKHRFGSYVVTREEVIAFARKFDPQPFHLSDEAAARTHFGRISASGYHTSSMAMAMLVKHRPEFFDAGLGGIGIDELRWLKPVYPGDTLSCETEMIEKRPSRSRPEMGSIRLRLTIFNQNDETVMRCIKIGLIGMRPTSGPAER